MSHDLNPALNPLAILAVAFVAAITSPAFAYQTVTAQAKTLKISLTNVKTYDGYRKEHNFNLGPKEYFEIPVVIATMDYALTLPGGVKFTGKIEASCDLRAHDFAREATEKCARSELQSEGHEIKSRLARAAMTNKEVVLDFWNSGLSIEVLK